MITVNLLATDRKSATKAFTLQVGQRLVVGCTVVLLAAGSFVLWRYLALKSDSRHLDTDLATAQKETARLHATIVQVQQFEQRRAQLQQRVTLIEQLRMEQKGPVHLLDQISRALPPMLWLTELKQTANANEVLVEGRCTSLTNLSDFVGSLEASGYFKKSIEIVSTQVESPSGTPPVELVKFQIKAIFQGPTESMTGVEAGAAPRAEGSAPAPGGSPRIG